MKQKGVTLVEMILYVALVAIISTSLIGLYINIIRLRQESVHIQEVNAAIRLAAAKIGYEIRSAKSILGVGDSLSLATFDPDRSPTTFSLNNGQIIMSVGSSSYPLTSNLVTINSFVLTNLSAGGTASAHVRYTISGSRQGKTSSVTSSAEMRSK